MLMGIRVAQQRTEIAVNIQRSILRNRRNVTASGPILSRSSGSLVWMSGGSQPKSESDMFGGFLSPTWYLTLGS